MAGLVSPVGGRGAAATASRSSRVPRLPGVHRCCRRRLPPGAGRATRGGPGERRRPGKGAFGGEAISPEVPFCGGEGGAAERAGVASPGVSRAGVGGGPG